MKLMYPLILFLAILASQIFVGAESSIPLSEHIALQEELSRFIQGYVQENLPNAQNFRMHSVYTQAPKKEHVKAFFNYSFLHEDLTTTQLHGFARLKKIKSQPTIEWSLENIEVLGEQITFDQPVLITPTESIVE